MKKKHKFGLALVLMLVLALQMTVSAAGNMTIAQCAIVGDQVTVIATGTQAASDSGEYYLFALQPYEAGIGTRTDYCASAPAGTAVTFTTPLNYNTASRADSMLQSVMKATSQIRKQLQPRHLDSLQEARRVSL